MFVERNLKGCAVWENRFRANCPDEAFAKKQRPDNVMPHVMFRMYLADELGRNAWEMVRKAERHLGTTLLIRRVGGRGGGDSQLSPDGRALLQAFQQLSKETAAFVDRRFAELYQPDGTEP